MFGIIASALAQFAAFLISKGTITAALFIALYWVVTSVATYILAFCLYCYSDGFSAVTNLANFVSSNPDFLYFAEVFQLWKAVKMILCAYAVRFLIRRIPFFG